MIRGALGTAAIALVGEARAERWPQKPVHVIIPSVAGSALDTTARLIGGKVAARLHQPFLVHNQPGAGATLATNFVAAAAPDGHTLLMTVTPIFPLGPLLFKSARYDAVTSFAPIATIGRASPFLVIHPGSPAMTIGEWVRLAASRPGELSIATGSPGGPTHLPTALFERASGARLLHVQYKDPAQALPEVIGGQVDAMFGYAVNVVPSIKNGRLRALAYAGARRNNALPDVPTFAESGLAGCEFNVDVILLGPAGLPDGIVTLLNREVALALQDAEVVALNQSVGGELVIATPAEVASTITRELRI